jgi:hypothetical protein
MIWFSDFIYYLLSAKCKPTFSLGSRQYIVFFFLVSKCYCVIRSFTNKESEKKLKITRAVGRTARSTILSA